MMTMTSKPALLGVYGEFDDGEPEGRNVCIFEPREGWVAVMDSSLEGNIELARELSAELNTDTMLVMVNDSDSWYYWLHRNGQSFDEFDSAGGAFDDDADEPTGEWLEAMENEDEDKLHELLMAKCAAEHQVPSPEYRPAVSNGGFGGQSSSGPGQLLGAAEVSLAVAQVPVQAADRRLSRRQDGLRLRYPAHAAGRRRARRGTSNASRRFSPRRAKKSCASYCPSAASRRRICCGSFWRSSGCLGFTRT